MAEAEKAVNKHIHARRRDNRTKVESRAKRILIHRRPILTEWCVKSPTDLEGYYSTYIKQVTPTVRNGRTIETNTIINGRLQIEGVGDVKELERRKFDTGIEAVRRAVHASKTPGAETRRALKATWGEKLRRTSRV